MRRSALALAGLCLSACGDLKLPAARASSGFEVQVEPLGTLGRAPAVLRLRVRGARGRANLGQFRCFEGGVSSYYLHRLAADDVPATLLEREVPVLTWTDGDDIVVTR